MAHEITIDEAYPNARGADADYAVQVYCSCGWSEDRWHHADQYAGRDEQADQAAADRDASAAGVEHLLSVQSP